MLQALLSLIFVLIALALSVVKFHKRIGRALVIRNRRFVLRTRTRANWIQRPVCTRKLAAGKLQPLYVIRGWVFKFNVSKLRNSLLTTLATTCFLLLHSNCLQTAMGAWELYMFISSCVKLARYVLLTLRLFLTLLLLVTEQSLCKNQLCIWILEPLHGKLLLAKPLNNEFVSSMLRKLLPEAILQRSQICCNGKMIQNHTLVDHLPAHAVLRISANVLCGGVKSQQPVQNWSLLLRPGGSWDQKLLVPPSCVDTLARQHMIEEIAIGTASRNHFAWKPGLPVDDQWSLPLSALPQGKQREKLLTEWERRSKEQKVQRQETSNSHNLESSNANNIYAQGAFEAKVTSPTGKSAHGSSTLHDEQNASHHEPAQSQQSRSTADAKSDGAQFVPADMLQKEKDDSETSHPDTTKDLSTAESLQNCGSPEASQDTVAGTEKNMSSEPLFERAKRYGKLQDQNARKNEKVQNLHHHHHCHSHHHHHHQILPRLHLNYHYR